MRPFFVACVTVTSALAAFSWAAGCTSNIKPPLADDDNPDGTAYVPPRATTSEDAGGGDAGAPVDAASPGCVGTPAGSCSDLALCGSKIYLVGATTPQPAATGGTLVPGTYNLTGVTSYGVQGIPAGLSKTYWFSQTFLVSPATAATSQDAGAPSEDGSSEAGAFDAGAFDAGALDAGAFDAAVPETLPFTEALKNYQDPLNNLTGVFTPSGTSLSLIFGCGGAPSVTGTYSAGATSFTLYLPEPSGGSLAEIYSL